VTVGTAVSLRNILASILLFACNPKPRPSAGWSEFVPETLPTPAGMRVHSVRHIRGSGPDDIWMLAYAVREDRSERERYTQGYHFDGTAWRLVDVPARAEILAVPRKGEAWVAGRAGTVARWTGGAWEPAEVPVDFDLVDLAVDGGVAWVAASGPELFRSSGKGWEPIKSEILSRFRIQKVLALGGEVIVPATWQGEAGVARFDGTGWRREVAGPGGIIRLAASSTDDVWGFGLDGNAFHHDGSGWRRVALPAREYPIDAVVVAPDDAWLVGDKGMVQRWDGRTWTVVETGTKSKLWTVWTAAGGPVFVGGDDGLLRLKPRSN
jgi:hypothetical protein